MFVLVPFAWGARAAVHAGRGEALRVPGVGGRRDARAGGGGRGVGGPRAAPLPRRARHRRGRRRGARPGAHAAARRGGRPRGEGPARRLARPAAQGPRLQRGRRAARLLLVLWQGSAGASGRAAPAVASFAGLGALGANAFALERRASACSSASRSTACSARGQEPRRDRAARCPRSSPCRSPRSSIAGPVVVPAVATVVLLTQVLAAPPTTTSRSSSRCRWPAAGRDPSAPVSGTRGLGAAAVELRRDGSRRSSSSAPVRLPRLAAAAPGRALALGADAAARPRGGVRPSTSWRRRARRACCAARAGARRPNGGED